MDLSSISHLFQQNGALQANRLSAKSAKNVRKMAEPGDMLQQLSEQMITKQQGSTGAASDINTREIKLDIYSKSSSFQSLSEMPDELLQDYLEMTKVFANTTKRQEQNLIDFKDRLNVMDQTIQGYQDILEGKAILPEGHSAEGILQSLTEVKQSREQFIKDGVEYLNKWGDAYVTSDVFGLYMEKVLGENKFAGKDSDHWKVDLSNSDIYAEIDRVLAETQGVTEELSRGIEKIYNILEGRGLENKYNDYLEDLRLDHGSYFDDIEAKSVQQMIIDNLKHSPLHEVRAQDKE